MHVNVVDSLPALFVTVHHDPEALLAAKLQREALRGKEDVAGKNLVFFSQVIERGDRFFGNDQKMNRRLWGNVMEGEHLVVFIDNLRRNFLGDNLAEQSGQSQFSS